jgi:hypothetical protein
MKILQKIILSQNNNLPFQKGNHLQYNNNSSNKNKNSPLLKITLRSAWLHKNTRTTIRIDTTQGILIG